MQKAYPAFVRKDLLMMLQLLLDRRCQLTHTRAQRAHAHARTAHLRVRAPNRCLHDDSVASAFEGLRHLWLLQVQCDAD